MLRLSIRLIAGALALAAGLAQATPSEELHAAFERFLSVRRFRASVIDLKKAQQISTMEFVAPDRYRIRTGPDAEQVIIGGNAWMMVNGRSVKLPLPIAKVVAQYRNPETLAEIERGLEVTEAGVEDVDGEPAKVYSYTLTTPVKAKVKAWVAQRSGQVLQVDSIGSFLGIKAVTRVRYHDLDDPLIQVGEPL